jgi:hypothetical protein
MKSMDTLSHGPSGIGKGCNKPTWFLLNVRFCWQVKQVFAYFSTLSFKLGQYRTSWGILWCALHHHGPQVTHHDILSRWHPSSSFPAHRVNSACITIVHFVNGSVTWLHFECFASFPWQIHHGGLLVELPFEVMFHPYTPL